jgi:hypothetical protein
MKSPCVVCARFLSHYAMFVRFRRQANRLQVSLIETRRASGKVVAEHIGTLGSVDVAMSVRERIAFWAKLPGRLAALDNRVGPGEHAKLYTAIHARIPMVTSDEQRDVQEENAKDEESFWGAMRDINAATAEDHKRLVASAEAKLKEHELAAADAADRHETAKERLARLKEGESVSGGLGKKLDVAATMKALGFTPRLMKQMQLMASLSEADFTALLKRADPAAAIDKAIDRELRRVMREPP